MNVPKILIIILIVAALILAPIHTARAAEETKTFFQHEFAEMSIKVDGNTETLPGANITVSLELNCTAVGVNVDYLNLTICGFVNGTDKTLLDSRQLMAEQPIGFNETRAYNYSVPVPERVWGATHAELHLKCSIKDLLMLTDSTGFTFTIVKNTYLEDLRNQLEALSKNYQQMQESFQNLTDTYQDLNKTYWELQQEYDSMKGSADELGNIRMAAVVLGITTFFFVATTVFLVMRKPRTYW